MERLLRVLEEELSDLEGVGGGAFTEVVRHNPQPERAGIMGVLTQPPYINLVLASYIAWHGIGLGRGVILEDDARRFC
jgi:hypothetical protein